MKRVEVLRVAAQVLAKDAGSFIEAAGLIQSVRILKLQIEHGGCAGAYLRNKSTDPPTHGQWSTIVLSFTRNWQFETTARPIIA